jgi:hypothetical protein
MYSSVRSHDLDPAKPPGTTVEFWEAGAVRHPTPTRRTAVVAAVARRSFRGFIRY